MTDREVGKFDYSLDQIGQLSAWTHRHWRRLLIGSTLIIGTGYMLGCSVRPYAPDQVQDNPKTSTQTLPDFLNNKTRIENLITVEKATWMLQELNQNITEIQAIRGSEKWSRVGTRYFVAKEHESIEDIASRNQTTPEKIRQLNKPNGLFGKDIFSKGEIFLVPVNPTPTRFFSELFDQAKKDLAELETVKKSKGASSPEAKSLAKKFDINWGSAPEKDKPVDSPEIIVEPDVKDGTRITSEIAELVDPLPKLGRFVKKISVIDWKKPPNGLSFTFEPKDPRAQIFIPTKLGHDKEDWTKEIRNRHLAGSIGSLVNIHRDDSLISQFMPKAELIKFLLEYTKITDKRIELFNPEITHALFEGEQFAWSIASTLTGSNTLPANQLENEVSEASLHLNNKWLSFLVE